MLLTWLQGLAFGLLGVPLVLALPGAWSGFAGAPHAGVFGVGAGLGLVATVLTIRKAPFLPILEHELTHLLVALLLLRQPLALSVGKEGGEVVYTGRSAFVIRLAPYVLPTVSLLLLALVPVVAEPHQRALRGVVGFTWGYHVTTALHETRPRQPDLRTGGLVPGLLGVFGLGTLLYVGTALWAAGDFDLCRQWLHAAWDRVGALYHVAVH